MTMKAEYRICPRCKKKYSWNPDVGMMWCPTCGPELTEKVGKNVLDFFFKKLGKKE